MSETTAPTPVITEAASVLPPPTEPVTVVPEESKVETKEEPKTESFKAEEPKTEEPKIEEPKTEAHAANPTPSKSSNTSKRLSVFLGKAKNFVDKVSEKKPVTPKKETTEHAAEHTEAEAETPTAEPVHAAALTEEPVSNVDSTTSTEEPAHTKETTSEKPKNEKRKSILGNIFRSKSPVKEVEKSEEPVAKTEESVKTETTATNKEETAAATAAAAEATSGGIVEEAHESIPTETTKDIVHKEHKENVIDTIKKGPLGKFFKKKEPEHTSESEEHPTEATTDTEPTVATAVEPTTTTTTTTNEAIPATHTEEKRAGSPLGRRITQMFRGFSHKKKTPEEKQDEPVSPEAEAAATATGVTPNETVVENAATEQEEHAAVAPTTTTLPAVQATA